MPNLKKMAVRTRSWSQFFSVSFSEYSGYAKNAEDGIKIIKEYEVKSTQRLYLLLPTRLKVLEILQ